MKETDILAVKMQMLQQSNWTYDYGFHQTHWFHSSDGAVHYLIPWP